MLSPSGFLTLVRSPGLYSFRHPTSTPHQRTPPSQAGEPGGCALWLLREQARKRHPLWGSWFYCHMAFLCSSDNTRQHVTFKIVEKTAFLGTCAQRKLYDAPWYIAFFLESSCSLPPHLPLWGPGSGSRALDGGRGAKREKKGEQGPGLCKDRRENTKWTMCLPTPPNLPRPAPKPNLLFQDSGPSGPISWTVQEATL